MPTTRRGREAISDPTTDFPSRTWRTRSTRRPWAVNVIAPSPAGTIGTTGSRRILAALANVSSHISVERRGRRQRDRPFMAFTGRGRAKPGPAHASINGLGFWV